MTVADEVRALRTATALAPGDHVACVRVRGAGAADALDRVSPRALFARTGKMSHTLLLADDARPLADVYLCCDEDDYLVLAEGLAAPALIDYLAAHAGGLDVAFEDLTPSHALVSLNGPYAWELLGELTTPDVIGLPYLGFFHADDFTCFRGGKTGEFGYELLIERARLAAVRDRTATVGRRFELAEISLEALELAQLEAFFWNARRESPPGVTPIELQLQWRVGYDRAYPGAAALAERRANARRRAVLIAGEREIAGGAAIRVGDREVGAVIHARPSPTRGGWLALALIDRAIAHAGLAGFAAGDVPVHTLSAPSVDNRSLHVDPQRHSFATRATDVFPPLVRA